ncbi:hypothetical protein [Necropsobacter rosorum]
MKLKLLLSALFACCIALSAVAERTLTDQLNREVVIPDHVRRSSERVTS